MPTGFYELQYIDKLEKAIEKLKKENAELQKKIVTKKRGKNGN